jgi:glycosyltransferase involved in cell wall biosynthesis
MKVAFVVQRYGLEICGGAEYHCRLIAEHMKKHFQAEVLTTRALDYITWKNYYNEDVEIINEIPVRRFGVKKERNPEVFGKIQDFVFNYEHKEKDEYKWLNEEGPCSPSLIKFIKKHKKEYDFFIFFSYRYYHSYWGITSVPEKSILVPTAEHDPVIHLKIFRNFFHLPRAFIYNSFEERKLINTISKNENILGDIVGVGISIPQNYSGKNFREKYKIKDDFILYLGRIDENKGCLELFDYFIRFIKDTSSPIKLVLIGSSILPIPDHPNIIHLGFLEDEDKFGALEACQVLIMPSFYESLSMVTLEAWSVKKPVLAYGRCEVLKGQCQRSNGGLYYENYNEFNEALSLLLSSSKLRKILGENGYKYWLNNYSWNVIEKKYLNIIEKLKRNQK